jgi:exopolysaccharide production protein ExoZ
MEAGSPSGEAILLNRLNLIRSAACLLIATYHVVGYLNMQASEVHWDMGWFAAPGFHLFLIMSGVLLAYTTRADDGPGVFMVKRVARLAPLYWLTTLLAVLIVLWRPWAFEHVDMSFETIAKSLLFIPFEDEHGRLMPINYVGWALNYTMVFYLVFALSLIAPNRWRASVLAGVPVAIVLGANLLPEGVARQFYSDPILLEFSVGALLGRALQNEKLGAWIKHRPLWPLATFGAAAMFATAHAYDQSLVSYTWSVAAYCASGALTMFALAAADLYQRPLQSKMIEWLGGLSYAILLVHPLLIPLLAVPLEARIANEWARLTLIVPIFLAASIAVAHLAYVAFEKPANAWLRRQLGPRKPSEIGSSGRPAR